MNSSGIMIIGVVVLVVVIIWIFFLNKNGNGNNPTPTPGNLVIINDADLTKSGATTQLSIAGLESSTGDLFDFDAGPNLIRVAGVFDPVPSPPPSNLKVSYVSSNLPPPLSALLGFGVPPGTPVPLAIIGTALAPESVTGGTKYTFSFTGASPFAISYNFFADFSFAAAATDRNMGQFKMGVF